MAKNITSATDTDLSAFVHAGHVALISVTGTWGGTSMEVQVKDGVGNWRPYSEEATQTADFDRYYAIPAESGLRLVTTGGGGIDLQASVIDYKPGL